jgi:hypothetical protein
MSSVDDYLYLRLQPIRSNTKYHQYKHKSSEYIQSLVLQFLNADKIIITSDDTYTPQQISRMLFNTEDISVIENSEVVKEGEPIIVNKNNEIVKNMVKRMTTIYNIIAIFGQALYLNKPEITEYKLIDDYTELSLCGDIFKAALKISDIQDNTVDKIVDNTEHIPVEVYDFMIDFKKLDDILQYFSEQVVHFTPKDVDDKLMPEKTENQIKAEELLKEIEIPIKDGEEVVPQLYIYVLHDATLTNDVLQHNVGIYQTDLKPLPAKILTKNGQDVLQITDNSYLVLDNHTFVHLFLSDDPLNQTERNKMIEKVCIIQQRFNGLEHLEAVFSFPGVAQEVKEYYDAHQGTFFNNIPVQITYNEQKTLYNLGMIN